MNRTKLLIAVIVSFLIAIGISAIGFTAEETFVPVTLPGTVDSKDKVKIKKVVTEQKITETFYSLPKERERLADLITKRDALNQQIADQEALIVKIQAEVDKVDLFTSPVPDFTFKITKGIVVFTNNTTGDYNSQSWDFGDGTTSDNSNPTHTYQANGAYKVTLNVLAPDGVSHSKSVNIVISGLVDL